MLNLYGLIPAGLANDLKHKKSIGPYIAAGSYVVAIKPCDDDFVVSVFDSRLVDLLEDQERRLLGGHTVQLQLDRPLALRVAASVFLQVYELLVRNNKEH